MIEAKLDEPRFSLTVRGHAGTEPEERLICAAASAYGWQAAAFALQMRDAGLAKETVCSVRPGDTVVSLAPAEGAEDVLRFGLRTVALGLKLLAEAEPERVSFTLREEERPPEEARHGEREKAEEETEDENARKEGKEQTDGSVY